MGMAFFRPTSWNLEVFDSKGASSAKFSEIADIPAAVPVFRQ